MIFDNFFCCLASSLFVVVLTVLCVFLFYFLSTHNKIAKKKTLLTMHNNNNASFHSVFLAEVVPRCQELTHHFCKVCFPAYFAQENMILAAKHNQEIELTHCQFSNQQFYQSLEYNSYVCVESIDFCVLCVFLCSVNTFNTYVL